MGTSIVKSAFLTVLGLISMRERALELGGSCVIEPAPGGTRVWASLPLRSQ